MITSKAAKKIYMNFNSEFSIRQKIRNTKISLMQERLPLAHIILNDIRNIFFIARNNK